MDWGKTCSLLMNYRAHYGGYCISYEECFVMDNRITI